MENNVPDVLVCFFLPLDVAPPKDSTQGHVMELDLSNYVARHGLVCAPSRCVCGKVSWEEHDVHVSSLLGVSAGDTSKRYRECFPTRDFGAPEDAGGWCEFFLSDGNCSCGMYSSGPDAYVNRFCAWPQGEGHGKAFMEKLKKVLAEAGFTRVWLFADLDCDNRVASFYEDKCGFTYVDENALEPCAEVPPEWIELMWGHDKLFVFRLR